MSLRKSAVAAAIALLVTVISIPSFAAGVKVAAGKTIIVTENSKTMKVDGNDITLEVEPQRINDRLLLPLRAFAEDALECVVSWDENTKTATIINGEKTIIVTENSKIMTVDGIDILMDIEPQRVNDRLLLPIRAFAQHALGCTVIWDENTKTATITGPSVASNPSPAETPKETEKPAEPVPVIKNPYGAYQAAKLWAAQGFTRSENDLSYILGYFIYQCCIESNIDPMTVDFGKLPDRLPKTSIDANGKIKMDFSDTMPYLMSGQSPNFLVENYITNLYTYILNRDEVAVKENTVNFLIEQGQLLAKINKGGAYSYYQDNTNYKEEYTVTYLNDTIYSNTEYSDYSFRATAINLYAAKTLKDFYEGTGLEELYKKDYDSVSLTHANLYKYCFSPNAKKIKNIVPNSLPSQYTDYKIGIYDKTRETRRLVLAGLTEEHLYEHPILNYLYGVKDGKAYLKSLDEIKEYTAARLKECTTYDQAKDILTLYYNIPGIYGVECPQENEIRNTIERISSGSLKGDNVKTSEQLATIKPLTDAEVRVMFKQLTGSDMSF